MVSIYLEGHSFKYGVRELVKMFYFDEEIRFVEDKQNCKQNEILIESYLLHQDDNYLALTKVIKNSDCISKSLVDSIKHIDINVKDIKKMMRVGIKQSIYKALSKIKEIKVPWGTLVGMRPVKIVHKLMDNGCNEKDIFRILCNEYKLFSSKAKLIMEIAEMERKYIYPLSKDRFSLYVSIPFCPTRCIYCSFPSNSIKTCGKFVDEYTDKIIYEIIKTGNLLKNKRIHTVYVGGGTPTAIPPKSLNRIINCIYSTFGRENIKEVTVEAGRPDTLNLDMLKMLKKNKVDRISINPQTMNDETLKLIGRNHNKQDIIESYYLARKCGFNTINMDLIIGLPNEGIKQIKYTLEEIYKLKPENLTIHTLAVKRASKFKKRIAQFPLMSQNIISDMLDISRDYAFKMNMNPYYLYRQKQMLGNFENVGYSVKDKECIYNMLIMEEKETIIAVGAGGVSKIFYPKKNKIERVPNVKDLRVYLRRVDEMVERKRKFVDII